VTATTETERVRHLQDKQAPKYARAAIARLRRELRRTRSVLLLNAS
jgi:hypothetical protein